MDAEQVNGQIQGESRLDKVSYYLLLALTVLLPIFFLPNLSFFPSLSLVAGKGFILYGIVIVLCILWFFKALRTGRVALPRQPITVMAILVPVVFVLSSLFSGSFGQSFFGSNIEIGTSLSILLATLLLFFTAGILNTKQRVFSFYLAFFVSVVITALFQLIRYFAGPQTFVFGLFQLPTSNMIGKWNELGVFFGLTSLLSMITLDSLTLVPLYRYITIAVLAVSLFFVGMVNFSYVSIAVGLFALATFIYRFVTHKKANNQDVPVEGFEGGEVATEAEAGALSAPIVSEKKISIPALVVLAVSLIFFLGGTKMLSSFSDRFNPAKGQLEVFVPTWSETLSVTKDTLKSNFIFGSGPNEFTKEWLVHKPAEINSSVFWGIDFAYGRGLLPSYLATTGVLGTLILVLFFVFFVIKGLKVLFKRTHNPLGHFLILSSFFGALYLWVFQLIYVPSEVIYAFAFLFTGVFVAVLIQENRMENETVSYDERPQSRFIVVLLIIVALIGSVSGLYVIGKKVVAANHFQKGSVALSQKGDLVTAHTELEKAVSYDDRDQYYRSLAQIDALKMGAILNQQGVKQDQIQAQVVALLPTLLDEAQRATKADKDDYQNWTILGQVYEGLLPLGYNDAYAKAQQAYLQAQQLNPKSPLMDLLLARLEAENKNVDKAQEYLTHALQLKPNYTDAVYLWSQIQIGTGNIKGAIDSVAQIAVLSPQDPTVFFQLGYLKYANKDYAGSVQSLEKAVSLNDQYANARYFLGLDYAKLGRFSDAITQFTEIQKYNQDNKEVQSILASLKAGQDPSASAPSAKVVPATTSSTKPLKIKKLPVQDTPTAKASGSTL